MLLNDFLAIVRWATSPSPQLTINELHHQREISLENIMAALKVAVDWLADRGGHLSRLMIKQRISRLA